MIIKIKTWAEIKNLASAKGLSLQYYEEGNKYYVFIAELSIVYLFSLEKNTTPTSDQTDFETNHKPTGNTSIPTPISGNLTSVQAKYTPKLAQTITKVTLTSTDQSILSITGEGRVDFINFRFSKDEVELSVWVDGVEAYRVDLEIIEEDHKLKSDEEDISFSHPIASGKTYQEIWNEAVDFSTSFEVKAKKTSSNPKMLSALIRYRLKV